MPVGRFSFGLKLACVLRMSYSGKEYDAPKQAAQSMAKGIKSKRPSTGGGPAKRAKK